MSLSTKDLKRLQKAEQRWFAEIRRISPEMSTWTDAELRAFVRQNKDAIFAEERTKHDSKQQRS